MAERVQLQTALETLLGTRNVYFQPPESLRLSYDCFVYKLSDPKQEHADDITYIYKRKYLVILITKNPDNPLIDRIVKEFKYCSLGVPYCADGLYHYPYTIYF